jgi:hypothetical protein
MQAQGLEWGEGYQPLARDAIAAMLRESDETIGRRAFPLHGRARPADRRNGSSRNQGAPPILLTQTF